MLSRYAPELLVKFARDGLSRMFPGFYATSRV
jgi:hypothetical protein